MALLRCKCESVQFIRTEQINTDSPNVQHRDYEVFTVRCAKPGCDESYIWNFIRKRWDRVARISGDEYMEYYTRDRSTYDAKT